MTSDWLPWQTLREETSWRLSRTDTAIPLPSWPVNCPWNIGMKASVIQPLPMPSWTVWFITLIELTWKEALWEKNSKLTQIDFCVKDLSTPASLRSDKGWPVSIGTSGRFEAEQLAEFSGIGRKVWPAGYKIYKMFNPLYSPSSRIRLLFLESTPSRRRICHGIWHPHKNSDLHCKSFDYHRGRNTWPRNLDKMSIV